MIVFDVLMRNLELSYPNLYIDICDSYVSNAAELTFTVKDGRRFVYDELYESVREIPRTPDEEIEDTYRFEFAYRLRRRMRILGVTQQLLAERLGISQSRVSDYVTGKRLPDTYLEREIAKVLRCTVDKLHVPY